MKYSLVIPIKNEEENIASLIEEIEPVMVKVGKPWELICIDDGSTDSSLAILTALKKNRPHLRVLKFTDNFGQSSAFDAGFQAARGEFVITLDGDRQNDPADIPKLLEAIEQADIVCGIRAHRKDSLSKKFTSRIANFIRKRLCDDGVTDTGCSLKVMRAACLKKIKMYHGMHRFLPALFHIEGFRVQEMPVNHRERVKGTTKYNFLNRAKAVADMFAVRWMLNRRLGYKIEREI